MLNQPESNKMTNKILAISGSILFIVAVFNRTFTSLDVDSQYVQGVVGLNFIIGMTMIGCVLPYLVIYRNENLKNWVDFTINNLLPVIYVPSCISDLSRNQNQVYDIESIDFS